MMTELRYRA